MTVTGTFPWKLGSFVLLLAIGSVIIYDTRKHGSFKGSSIGKFLNEYGAFHYGDFAWVKTKYFSSHIFRYCVRNTLYYFNIGLKYGKPYLEQGCDTCVFMWNQLSVMYEIIHGYLNEKIPIAAEWVNYYAPGLLDMLKLYCTQALENIKYLSNAIWQLTLETMFTAEEWTKTNVFVGSFSPDNIQQYCLGVLNTIQTYAEWTYDWVCQKVQTLSKIQ